MIKKLLIYSSFFVLVTPYIAEAGYCVQVSSVNKIDKNYILKKAKNKIFQDKPDVRVEKIGRYLTLRVGDFKNQKEALSTLKEIQTQFPDAFVRTCTKHTKGIIYSNKVTNSINQKHPATAKVTIQEIPDEKNEKIIDTVELPPNYIYQE